MTIVDKVGARVLWIKAVCCVLCTLLAQLHATILHVNDVISSHPPLQWQSECFACLRLIDWIIRDLDNRKWCWNNGNASFPVKLHSSLKKKFTEFTELIRGSSKGTKADCSFKKFLSICLLSLRRLLFKERKKKHFLLFRHRVALYEKRNWDTLDGAKHTFFYLFVFA